MILFISIPALNFHHPAFDPYRNEIIHLTLAYRLPDLALLNALATARGLVNARKLPLHFTTPERHLLARDYEQHILQTGCIPTRPDNWHDVMNALVWLRFPQFKAALNAAHAEAIMTEIGPLRGRRRDALTMLDESGVWVVSENAALPDLLRQREWQTLFWTQRAAVIAQMQFVIVGHALLEKVLQPYPSITGKCLLLDADADWNSLEVRASRALAAIEAPDQLAPLPLMGIPGWDTHNAHAAYYANPAVFRPPRKTG